MKKSFKIAVFEGDGIGPEIMAPTLRLLDGITARSGSYRLDFDPLPAGAAHYARTGAALPAAALDRARQADAILLAAMGLPAIRKADGTELTPQIDLRDELDLFAGVRPVRITPCWRQISQTCWSVPTMPGGRSSHGSDSPMKLPT